MVVATSVKLADELKDGVWHLAETASVRHTWIMDEVIARVAYHIIRTPCISDRFTNPPQTTDRKVSASYR
jgi:predicted transcriptional regulator